MTYHAIIGGIMFDEGNGIAVVYAEHSKAVDLGTDNANVAEDRADRFMKNNGMDSYIIPDLSRKEIVYR